MADLVNFDELYPPDSNTSAPTPAATSPQPNVGYAEDIGKGAVSGVGLGLTGLAGLPGNLAGPARDWVASKLYGGYDSPGYAAYKQRVADNPYDPGHLPTSADVQAAVEPYTGKFYEPKTIPGQFASTLGSFAATAPLGPGTLGAKALNAVTGAIGSEAFGQYARAFGGTGDEPWARFIGGLAAGVGGAKLLTPSAPTTAQRVADVATLKGAGIPLTAGETTGSKLLQTAESSAADMPFSAGAAQDAARAQAAAVNQYFTNKAFDPAALERAGVPPGATLPSQDVMAKGVQTLKDEYNRIHSGNELTSTPQLHSDLLAHENAYYNQGLPTGKSPALANARNDIVDALVAGRGRVSGAKYQGMRSDLGDIERGAYAGQNPDTALGAGASGMKQALDQAYVAGLPPADAAALAATNQRYANMKQLIPAVNAGGENLVPSQIAGAVRSGRAVPYSQGLGNMDEVARAAQNVLKPLPNSMTAARTGWQSLFNAAPWLLTAAGGVAGGAASGINPLWVLGGAAIPHAVGRAIVSGPVQRYLGNTALPQSSRDVISQAMLQQAATQPSSIVQNASTAAAYNAQRDQHLRDLGLAPRAPANIGTVTPAAPYDFAPVR